jgi:hypothetical protein
LKKREQKCFRIESWKKKKEVGVVKELRGKTRRGNISIKIGRNCRQLPEVLLRSFQISLKFLSNYCFERIF